MVISSDHTNKVHLAHHLIHSSTLLHPLPPNPKQKKKSQQEMLAHLYESQHTGNKVITLFIRTSCFIIQQYYIF